MATPSAAPTTSAAARPSSTSWRGHREVVAEQRAVLPQRVGDLRWARGGSARRRRRRARAASQRAEDSSEARAATRGASRRPQRARAPARAARRPRVRALARARQVDLERRPPPARAAARAARPVGQQRPPPRRRASRAAPSAARARARRPAMLHLHARQRVERAERLVEAQHGPARPAACAGTRRAGASRPTAPPAGPARSPRARTPRSARAPRARASRPRRARHPQRQRRRCRARSSHGSSPSRWGISTAGAARTCPASGACSPHTSSSSVDFPQPLGPTTATISRGAARSDTPSSALHGAERLRHALERHARVPRSASTRLRREPRSVCASLPPRALPHRFEGSAPGSWALSQPASASPPGCPGSAP